jgi:hypothetical protein
MAQIAFNVPIFAGITSSLELLERLHTFGEVVGDVLKLGFGANAIPILTFITSFFWYDQISIILPQYS